MPFRRCIGYFIVLLTLLVKSVAFAQREVAIDAIVQGGPVQRFYLSRSLGGRLDSATTFSDDSSQTMHVAGIEKGLYSLQFEKVGRMILLLLDEKDSALHVRLNNKQISISGSYASAAINSLVDTLNQTYKHIRALEAAMAMEPAKGGADSAANSINSLKKKVLDVSRNAIISGQGDLFIAYAIRFIPSTDLYFFKGLVDTMAMRYSSSSVLQAAVADFRRKVQSYAENNTNPVITNAYAQALSVAGLDNMQPSLKQFNGKYREDTTYTFPSVLPEFIGGRGALNKFIYSNLAYPDSARKHNIEGKVVLQFRVDTLGRISNIKVIKGIGYGCDAEAIRVVSKMPAWNPGRQYNRKVASLYHLPVLFVLKK